MAGEYEKFAEIVKSGRRLNVFLHDNPDPDSIAAGLIAVRIAAFLGVKARILHGGKIERSENRAMVNLLGIGLVNIDTVGFVCLRTDRCMLVDTQPGTGNNSFPRGMRCHIVIDHHPQRKDVKADFMDIRPDEGACTTIMLGYLESAGLEPDPEVATASAYAIASETQDLEREATRADREAFLKVFPHVRLKILGRIRHPIRERAHFKTLTMAVNRALVGRNTCICHIGEVHSAEAVAEVADFLLPMEKVTWCLVSGFIQGKAVVSIRTKHAKARADLVMRRILGRRGRGGGHHMIAGGRTPCADMDEYRAIAADLTVRFLGHLRRGAPEALHGLLDPDEASGR